MGYETGVLITVLFFLAIMGFFSTIAPPEYKVMDVFDFAWLAGSFISIAGTCAIETGLLCAGALAAVSVVSFWQYFVVTVEWFKTLIITPILVILIYLAVRIARGGG